MMNNVFFNYLDKKISIEEFEKSIYYQSEIENQLSPIVFQKLLEFNYKNEKSESELKKLIIENVIEKGNFEKWKLINLLSNFITDVKNAPKYLNEIYDLFLGQYQENGSRIYEYKFLGNLGLNYFYWLEEGYLKTIYGNKWKDEYNKLTQYEEIEKEHQKLKPVAKSILNSLKNNEIQINNNGTYSISEELKQKLEA